MNSIGTELATLYYYGARNFLILNVPNIGLLPSIQILDGVFPGAAWFGDQLAQGFNNYLDFVVDSLAAAPGTVIARLDVYDTFNQIIANPETFGLSEVAAACLNPGAHASICRNPERHFFWDGVHPTKVGHAIFAQ